ncbi:hypothetical protein B0H13DRAFT_2326303 [Mycena leptocephala]|nr:hypothetical protein B0H13DRAFT_2326303 [Mycena leptocephala]
MSFFPYSSGIEINGGNFLNIAGNMNVDSAQPLGPLPDLGFGVEWEYGRELLGPERSGRASATRRPLPYAEDISTRPQILSGLRDSSIVRTDDPAIFRQNLPSTAQWTPSFRNSVQIPQYPFSSQPEPRIEAAFLPPLMISGTSTPQNNHDFYPGFSNRTISYPSTSAASGNCGNDRHPFPNTVREFARESDGVVSTVPWDRPEHQGKTSIHGGTFINSSVSHIQRQGETGEPMHL